MDIKIYNTLSGKKEIFKTLENNKVKFYQCGPTVYWTQHIGNLRAMTMADIINRFLRYIGYDVNFLRNYTDVGHLTSDSDEGEDKMDVSATKEKISPKEIADKYIKIFEQDTAELNNLEPNIKSRATENINEILEMIKILFDKGFAYQTDLAIYFDVLKAKNDNRLSGQILEEQKTEPNDKNKKYPADFALWFFKKGKHANALQIWPSEWGEGFPGWHIECSAMIKRFLGKTIDIHMGGIEHIPIHHTNEIAQSEAVNDGVPLANYWVHNEHLLVDGKKMAKSEGTGFSLAEVKEKGFDPLALRYFFLQAHYRSKQNFTWQALKAAENGLKNLYSEIRELKNSVGEVSEEYKNKFIDVISDDFNTPQALAVVQELLKSDLSDDLKMATLLDFDKVLGLKIAENIAEQPEKIPQEVIELAEKRMALRKSGNWQEADKLRQKIKNLGFEIEDTEKGFDITRALGQGR
ncbi:MAG: cysteinyl-tRNA synthetase [Parcubacteria group bacterium Athens0714_24]|nr:MAG: cysteinyl-tRNA synthetase [Parcubacteria group bacterium Athens0714_24]